jgi:tetratricopeptide (TPR) repeat protein
MSDEAPKPSETTLLIRHSDERALMRNSIIERGLRDITEYLHLQPIQHLIDEAFTLFQQRHYEEALTACNSGLAIDPRDSALLQVKGLSLVRLGKYDDGLQCIDLALEIDPTNHYCLELRNRVVQDYGPSEKSGALDKSLVIPPSVFDSENPTLVLSLGGYYEEPAKHFPEYRPGMRCLVFYSAELENRDDYPHCVAKELSLFRRSFLTDHVSESPNTAFLQREMEFVQSMSLLEFAPTLNLPPWSATTVKMELIHIFEEGLSADECVESLFDLSEVFVYDVEHKMAILVKAS